MSPRYSTILLVVAACPITLGGCRDGVVSPEADGDRAGSVVRNARRGPVTMTATLRRGDITTAERFELTVEVVVPEGVNVEMPRFSGPMVDFAVRDYRERPAERREEMWRRCWEYRLDVFHSGEFTIPGMTAAFADLREQADGAGEAMVAVDAFPVKVRPFWHGEFDPAAFRDIKGPIPLPPDRTWDWVWWTGAGVGGTVLSLLFALWIHRKREREALKTALSPRDWAIGQLRTLADERLVERGLVRELYFRLSMIVRQYVERRFGLGAPGWTTEEFWAGSERTPAFPEEYRGTMGSFLVACDRVKYAQYVPRVEEVEGMFKDACDLVNRTDRSEIHQVSAA